MSVSADLTFPDGLTEEYLLNQALLGETAVDGARHGIAPHAPHALQASPHASPAPHAHAPHAGVQLDVRAHAPCTHAHSPHGMLTTRAAGPPHALQPFGQSAFGQLSVLAESAPSGASPNEVIMGRHVPSPSASIHHDASMPSPISQYSPRSNACRPLVARDAQSELKTLRREFDEMKIVVEKLSSDVKRFRFLSSEKLEEIVAPRLDTSVHGMSLKPSAAHDLAPTGCVGTFPCQVRYDPRAAPTRAKASRWVESMLGKSHFNLRVCKSRLLPLVHRRTLHMILSATSHRLRSLLRFPLRVSSLINLSIMLVMFRVRKLTAVAKIAPLECPTCRALALGIQSAPLRAHLPLLRAVETVGDASQGNPGGGAGRQRWRWRWPTS